MRAPRQRGKCHRDAPVAQPDRVVASEAIGRGFESLRARHGLLRIPRRLAPCATFWNNPRSLLASARQRAPGRIVRNYDLDFLKKFSMVIGFLAALTVALILFAHHLQGTLKHDPD